MLDINKLYKGMDARSTRGILSRGKNVYRGGSNSPGNRPNIQKAARKRLGLK